MASPPDPISIISTLITVGKEIQARYTVYTHAKEDLKRLDSLLQLSLNVLETFQQVIMRGIDLDVLSQNQHESVIRVLDQLQGVFDKLVLLRLSDEPCFSSRSFFTPLDWTARWLAFLKMQSLM
jgi:hypothetical protein